jgi:ABC-2 type transport system ATP-binding protein
MEQQKYSHATDAGNSGVLAALHKVRKVYGSVVALDGIDLSVRAGELLAFLGPNGAGKSTAIALLLGLQRPTEGSVTLFGESPQELRARRRIGVMMQEVALSPELKVREHVDLASSYYPDPLAVDATLELTGITALAQRRYRELSGGQKRQVQFAIAVCGQPKLLFLDEPTVGLDVQARETLWRTVRKLIADGCSIVLTTHYLEEAEALANRVVVVNKGRVVASGSVRELRAFVSRRQVSCVSSVTVQKVLEWGEVTTALDRDGRITINTTQAESVVRKLLNADASLSELEVRRAGLAEIFAELTQETA